MKNFSASTILGLTFGVFLAGYAVFAFQAPSQAPPGGNVPAPVNVGPDPQVKSGGLWVGSLGVDGGVVVGGGLSVGKIPTDPGDVITKGYLDAAFVRAGLVDSDKDGIVDNLDCAPSDNTKWQNLLVYTDSDQDGYGTGQVQTKCAGGTAPSGFSINQSDCYDSNASAHPGQTSYFPTNRGDGSFDYDCSGSAAQRWTGSFTNTECNLNYLSPVPHQDQWEISGSVINGQYVPKSVPACGIIGSLVAGKGLADADTGEYCEFTTQTAQQCK